MPATRRAFLHSAVWSGAALAQKAPSTPVPSDRVVSLAGDGVMFNAAEHARLVARICEEKNITDTYLAGGAVEQLEQQCAKLLGKESAVFLATGTLANLLAVRELAGEKRRVIVQQESHLYADESDGAQLLSGLNLVGLAPDRATIKLEEVVKVAERSAGPPYPVPVGAISIESPVRRANGEIVDFDEMKKICSYAREKQIGTHLDGARVFLASGYSGISPAQYAALFDTVYISMYKYFNAPFGAILAGPAPLIKRVAGLRHAFGSLIYRAWEPAAIALHYLDGFSERYQTAVRNGEQLMRLLAAQGQFQIERVSHGSNIAKLKLATGTLGPLQQRLAEAGIILRGAKDSQTANIQINETLNRKTPEEIAQAFRSAAA